MRVLTTTVLARSFGHTSSHQEPAEDSTHIAVSTTVEAPPSTSVIPIRRPPRFSLAQSWPSPRCSAPNPKASAAISKEPESSPTMGPPTSRRAADHRSILAPDRVLVDITSQHLL